MIKANGVEISPDRIREVISDKQKGKMYYFIGFNDKFGIPRQVRLPYTQLLDLQIKETRIPVKRLGVE